MGKIKVMDELLANKIAAGEVVEKCASVVKELVENSIDAGSSEIKIELVDSGTKMIKVTDNGKGMDESDSLLAFSRHATSKLYNENDLYQIMTLGFRGEALPSIASVSDVILKTSTGEVGNIVHIKGGKLISNQKGDARKGTIIAVNDLFYNTPARLKHLKSLYSELSNISDYVSRIALSHPEIKFTLFNNESVILKTDGRGDLLKTINDIYGLDTTKKMIEIKGSNNDYEVTGYISKPEIHRSTRSHMITIVNGRVVRNMDLNRIINDSYHGYKPDNRYPITIINIELDPTLVDVNIHPTKMDIKFSKLEELLELVTKIIKESLSDKTLIPTLEYKEEQSFKESFAESIYKKTNYEEIKLDLNRVEENNYYDVKKENVVHDIKKDIILEKNVQLEEKLPELYPVGLIHGTYIVCQNELGMYLIDQHAAKERVNYEFYKNKLGNPGTASTSLLIPITIELTNSEFIILKQNFEILTNMNFDIQEFGINSIIIKSHPLWLPKGYEEEAIRRIIDLIVSTEKNFNVEKFNDSLAATISCKMSIKANNNITLEEMENLINDLRKCDNPFNCPHGRPTIVTFTNYDLEKLFKRSGF